MRVGFSTRHGKCEENEEKRKCGERMILRRNQGKSKIKVYKGNGNDLKLTSRMIHIKAKNRT